MKKYVLALAFVLLLSGCFEKKMPNIPENENAVSMNENDSIEYVETTLYFPDDEAMYLHGESRQLMKSLDEVEKATEILKLLFEGPVSEELYPSLRGECCVNFVTVSDGLCTVDFSRDFVINNTGGSAQESFAIGSIVNSLCELDSVNSVKINIDGNENAEFGGHFMLDAAFEPLSFAHVMDN